MTDRRTSAEVCRATGATPRMLQWWDERGVIKPLYGVEAHSRYYSEGQIDTIRKLLALRRSGLALCGARKLVEMEWQSVVVSRQSAIVVGETLVLFAGEHAVPLHRPPAVRRAARATLKQAEVKR